VPPGHLNVMNQFAVLHGDRFNQPEKLKIDPPQNTAS
jgi:hypothetical protein